MSRLNLYLDTSVISAMLDDRTPERKAMTEAVWVKFADCDVWVSSLVKDELNMARAPLKERFLSLISSFGCLDVTDEAMELAHKYVGQGIFPDAYFDDALHVSLASVNGIPYLISWNFKHLVKVKTRRMVALANALADYPPVEIIAPPEL